MDQKRKLDFRECLEKLNRISSSRNLEEDMESDLDELNPSFRYSDEQMFSKSTPIAKYLNPGQIFKINVDIPEKKPSVKKQEPIPKFQFCQSDLNQESVEICIYLKNALNIRKKYHPEFKFPFETMKYVTEEQGEVLKSQNPIGELRNGGKTTKGDSFFMNENGVLNVKLENGKLLGGDVLSMREFYNDYRTLYSTIFHSATKGFCHKRIKMLQVKFDLFKELYSEKELLAQKQQPHRDFFNVRKIDNHCHLSSSMNQKTLLLFMKKKIRTDGDTVVQELVVSESPRITKQLTLNQVFEKLNLSSYDLSVDGLDVFAGGRSTFHRFDLFNMKFNPFASSELRDIFLKYDNYLQGTFFAELIREHVVKELDKQKYQKAEYGVSIYGKNKDELRKLALWAHNNGLVNKNVKFIIQIPRLYESQKKKKNVECFEAMLDNVFHQFFYYTQFASKDEEHAIVANFLENCVVGFDTVDDESKPEVSFNSSLPDPRNWKRGANPPYAYYVYYIWANVSVLNSYRRSKKLRSFRFRPHSGESGALGHLICSFMLAENIAHGIELRRSPTLTYLFYLTQIGLSMAPLSNNALFLMYLDNPFKPFFNVGLNVSLTTDDPLMFHQTHEPLMEEYSVAQQIFKLDNIDVCEIARNSVMQCGFSSPVKSYWVSPFFNEYGIQSNNLSKTNVPPHRIKYRHETLVEEHLFIQFALCISGKYFKGVDEKLCDLNERELRETVEKLQKYKTPLFASGEKGCEVKIIKCSEVVSPETPLMTQSDSKKFAKGKEDDDNKSVSRGNRKLLEEILELKKRQASQFRLQNFLMFLLLCMLFLFLFY